jgi:hypothetical protein
MSGWMSAVSTEPTLAATSVSDALLFKELHFCFSLPKFASHAGERERERRNKETAKKF